MEYKLIRSKRKSIGLQVKNAELIVRAPVATPILEIETVIARHKRWIMTRLEAQRKASEAPSITSKDIESLAKKAKEIIPPRVNYYASRIGVTYGSITIRNQKTRWGSCSMKGDLNFNCLLMLSPVEVLDSVIVHELCHRKHMDHSKAFYDEVVRAYPEYHKWHGWLKKNGRELIGRMLKGENEIQ